MLKFRLLVVQLLFSAVIFAQCETNNTVFKPGEKLEYQVFYNLGFIWVEAGKVVFEVKDADFKGVKTYHLIGTGTSLSAYDWIFKVRDRYDSYIEKTSLLPLKYIRNTSEGSYKVNNQYLFDYQKKKIYSEVENSKQSLKKDTLTINGCIYDILASMYYARNMDFSKFQPDKKIPFKSIIDNEIHNLYGKYLGEETVTTRNDVKYRCLKFSAQLLEGSMFSGGENLTVWVSDDENKIPVKVETEILVGSVKVFLHKYSGLRHAENSIIK